MKVIKAMLLDFLAVLKDKPLMHGHPFILVMTAPSTALLCQLEIWILLPVPECCVHHIDICGACGRLAEVVWCRFSQRRLLGIVHVVWGQNWELSDGYSSTTFWPYFTSLVGKFTKRIIVLRSQYEQLAGNVCGARNPTNLSHCCLN